MSTRSKHAYHHGDLREALIEAARHAIDQLGPETITLKSLAMSVGVTQSAPYRHFPSREAVLQAVAADGFERFRGATQPVKEGEPFDTAFERTAMAYIRFGQANPGVYRLMFSAGVFRPADPKSHLATESTAAFEDLLRLVAGRTSPTQLRAIATWIWATLHGIVMLESDGLLSGPGRERTNVEDVVRELVRAILIRLHERSGQRSRLTEASSRARKKRVLRSLPVDR